MYRLTPRIVGNLKWRPFLKIKNKKPLFLLFLKNPDVKHVFFFTRPYKAKKNLNFFVNQWNTWYMYAVWQNSNRSSNFGCNWTSFHSKKREDARLWGDACRDQKPETFLGTWNRGVIFKAACSTVVNYASNTLFLHNLHRASIIKCVNANDLVCRLLSWVNPFILGV